MTHSHLCHRCHTSYQHLGSRNTCRAGRERLCDACWKVFKQGVNHPDFGMTHDSPPANEPGTGGEVPF